jgi:hypothetical protein
MRVSMIYELEVNYPSIFECIKILKANSAKIIFFTKNGLLIGCLSQGDILEAVLQNQDLNSSSSRFINKSPLTIASRGELNTSKISNFYKNGGLCIPELDEYFSILNIHEYISFIKP